MDTRIGQVGFYLGTEDAAPSETERIALERAEQRLRVILDRVNRFFAEEWSTYRQTMEKADPRFFDDHEHITIDNDS